jgi:hypothetical protein
MTPQRNDYHGERMKIKSVTFTAGMSPSGIPAVDAAFTPAFSTECCRLSHLNRSLLVAVETAKPVTVPAGHRFIFNLFSIN